MVGFAKEDPIERLWKIMNEFTHNNRFFETAKEFKKAISDFFLIIWPRISRSMVNRINDNFQILNKASSS